MTEFQLSFTKYFGRLLASLSLGVRMSVLKKVKCQVLRNKQQLLLLKAKIALFWKTGGQSLLLISELKFQVNLKRRTPV